MSPEEAKLIIGNGESLYVELKAGLSSKRPEQICKEIAALATSQGGHLFLGVDDSGTVCGVSKPRQLQNQIENWISEYIRPVPAVDVSILNLEQLDVICIEVRRGSDPIYYMDGRPYLRVGTSSVPASPEQVEGLIRHSEVSLELRQLEARLSSMSVKLHPQNNIAAGFTGQCELATMTYSQLLARLIDDLPKHFDASKT